VPVRERLTEFERGAPSERIPSAGRGVGSGTVQHPSPILLPALALAAALVSTSCSGMFEKTVETKAEAAVQTLHSFRVEALDGGAADLAAWKGKVVLVVNTASECGFTGQYAGLQALHERLGPRGFAVLGFPCNDFGGQEPGGAGEIRAFCTSRYQVTFPLFARVRVRAGPEQSPLYAWLGAATGKLPGWNFGKYLIGRDGRPVGFWPSTTAPDDAELAAAIERALSAG
jgi:glutathione peroxidase